MYKQLALAVATLLATLTLHAYDEDTHFFNTYSMSRFIGIKHETALFMAFAAQWVDESPLTAPLAGNDQMIFPRNQFIRRYYHFTCPLFPIKAADDLLHSSVCYTAPNNPNATELVVEGMQQGDLMMTGMGLHALEDSWAHAGFGAKLGHAAEGHWPDRQFANRLSIRKYEFMMKKVFTTLVRIRALLPARVLDMRNPTMNLSGPQIADLYFKEISAIYHHNVLKDRKYLEFVIPYLIKRAQDKNLILPGLNTKEIGPTDAEYENKEKLDANVIIHRWITRTLENQNHGGQRVFDVQYLANNSYRDQYKTGLNKEEYFRALQLSRQDITRDIEKMFVEGVIPVPLSQIHHEELEVENTQADQKQEADLARKKDAQKNEESGPGREKEMELRFADWTNYLRTKYAVEFKFDHFYLTPPKRASNKKKEKLVKPFIPTGLHQRWESTFSNIDVLGATGWIKPYWQYWKNGADVSQIDLGPTSRSSMLAVFFRHKWIFDKMEKAGTLTYFLDEKSPINSKIVDELASSLSESGFCRPVQGPSN